MVKLLLKWPNLYYSTSAFAPKHYPKDIIDFANTRGADKIIYAGYFSAGLDARPHLLRAARTCRSATTSGPSSCARTRSRVFKLERPLARDGQRRVRRRARGGRRDRHRRSACPKSREEMSSSTASSATRRRTPSRSRARAASRCPRGYMFKEPPGWDADELGDPVEILIAEHGPPRHPQGDRLGVEDEQRRPARCASYPDRFFAVDRRRPEQGMEAVRKIERYAGRVRPQVRRRVPGRPEPAGRGQRQEVVPDLREVRGARHPVLRRRGRARARASRSRRRTSRRLDEVCWYFPELKFVTRHGCEPWTELAVKLHAEVAEPLLLDHRVRAEALPEGHHRLREHARRRQDHLDAATSPPGLTYDRIFAELPDVPFRDHVWPKFLHENAARVFKLD